MSLLTKEQLQIVDGIKSMIADYDYKTDQIRGLFDLVSIIDDLQARAPRETAEPDKDLPQEMHGYPFNMSLSYFAEQCKRHVLHPDGVDFSLVFEYIIERCSRAESRAPQPLATEQADKSMKDEAVRLLSRRQYTEQEVGAWLKKALHELPIGVTTSRESLLYAFARHVGALKAEP